MPPLDSRSSPSVAPSLDSRIAELFKLRLKAAPLTAPSDLLVFPGIPEKSLQRARATYAPYDDDEMVLGMIDNTIAASDEGLLITHRRIFFTAAPPAKKRQHRFYLNLGYSVPDGQTLTLADGTVLVLVAEPGVGGALALFLNDAHDAALASTGGPRSKIIPKVQPEDAPFFIRCWFCENGLPDDASAVPTRLQRQSRKRGRDDPESIELETDTATIKVPRCAKCATAHVRRENQGMFFFGAAFLLFIGVWVALGVAGYPKLGFVAGAFLGLGLGGYLMEVIDKSRRFLPAGTKAEIEMVDFPPAKRLESEGWRQLASKENFYTRTQLPEETP